MNASPSARGDGAVIRLRATHVPFFELRSSRIQVSPRRVRRACCFDILASTSESATSVPPASARRATVRASPRPISTRSMPSRPIRAGGSRGASPQSPTKSSGTRRSRDDAEVTAVSVAGIRPTIPRSVVEVRPPALHRLAVVGATRVAMALHALAHEDLPATAVAAPAVHRLVAGDDQALRRRRRVLGPAILAPRTVAHPVALAGVLNFDLVGVVLVMRACIRREVNVAAAVSPAVERDARHGM